MQNIGGKEKNLMSLLMNKKYALRYYQRGYTWQEKQVVELVDDLTSEFLLWYKDGDQRQDVLNYGIYFMGSIVLAGNDNAIIDGQQRLTSLTLLLIYLLNRLRENGEGNTAVEQMIFSTRFGKKSFNLDIPERQECMEALFNNSNFSMQNAEDSVKNLYARYKDIADRFQDIDIQDNMIQNFCDWLAERVYFIEIIASEEQDAYKIFVTTNNRGLGITPTEMLKGYILSEIKDGDKRSKLDALWRETVHELTDGEAKGDDSFFKMWLRAQYADTIREHKAAATNQDFESIGTSFHNWVLDEKEKMCLLSTHDYEQFVLKFSRFAKVYRMIRDAEKNFRADMRHVFYNARVAFTFQLQLLLAPICFDDSEEVITQKIDMTARFIEFYILSRVINGKSLNTETIKLRIFELTKTVRRLSVEALRAELLKQYENIKEALKGKGELKDILLNFSLNKSNKKYIKHLLARITSFIEESSGKSSHYIEYIDTSSTNPYEIEHIIADNYSVARKDYSGYSDQADFSLWRNKFGALLLLRKKINASIGSAPYVEKLKTYSSTDGNLYAASLDKSAYNHNPGFLKLIEDNNLRFKPYSKFRKMEIGERTALLAQIISLIWNPDMFN